MASLSTPTALDCPPPTATIDLPYEETSPSEARRWAGGVLCGRVGNETTYAVLLCISELVTNAHVHTKPSRDREEITCHLVIITGETVRVRVEVIDAGSPSKTPKARKVDACAESGRGLSQVVAGYADSWGYEQRSPHDCVTWFEVVDGADRRVDGAVLVADGIG
jgi:anti-sigma regulatory factor (Ser/Thr protein kinase)